MKSGKQSMAIVALICAAGLWCLSASPLTADGGHGGGRFEREDQHSTPLLAGDDEGNETAGQIAAWLLFAANLPVLMSILIKSTNRFVPLGETIKSRLAGFNRFQKRHLMGVHYYLNLAIIGIVSWHYVSSRCRSTALPEWGLVSLLSLVGLGILIKFRLGPKAFRKIAHRIHTQPAVFAAMILMLTVGHLIVD